MKRDLIKSTFAAALTALPLLLPAAATAQVVDAIQISSLALPSGARAEAMGGSLLAVPGGVDALEFNPAAMALIKNRDLTFSLFDRAHSSSASFLGASSDASLSSTSVSAFGIATPFETVRGHLAAGVSFDRVYDYTSTYSFSAVDPNSSFFNTKGFLTTNGSAPYQLGPGSVGNRQYLADNNIAYALGLTYEIPDSGAFTLSTPFTGGLKQSGTVTESGYLDAIRCGAAIDIAEGISAGATLNLYFGSYDYLRDYQETDVNGIFAHDTGTTAPAGFKSAEITDVLHREQTGTGLKLGLLFNDLGPVRLGLTLETPTIMHIDETSSRTGIAHFPYDTYDFPNMNGATSSEFIYDVITPIRMGAGASFHGAGLLVAASVSYADMSQIQFSNSDLDLSQLNTETRTLLRGVLSGQFGAEYTIPGTRLALRGGYSFEPSAYKGDPANYATTAISGGLGIGLGRALRIDAAFRHLSYHTNHSIYNDYSLTGNQVLSAGINDDAVTRNDLTISLNYHY